MKHKQTNEHQLSLDELLYLIKEQGEIPYSQQLLKNEQVKEVIKRTTSRIKSENKEDLYQKAHVIIQDIVIREYRYDSEYTEERFLNIIKKSLGKRLRNGEN
jgi:CHAT domain-containing protein